MTTWEGDYMKAIVHMMGHIAKDHRVLFVDYAFTFKDLLYGLLGRSNVPVKRMVGIAPRLRKISYKSNELYHLTLPPTLPIHWIKNNRVFDLIMKLQTKLLSLPALKRAIKKLKFSDPVMINAFNPTVGMSLLNHLDVSQSIYYCYDEIGASGWGSKHGKRLENKFARSVDQIIVSSTALLASKSRLNKETQLIKNGVDFELFHQAYQNKTHADRPQIGYVGSIDFRIDFHLLLQVVKRLPGCDFTFVGRITDWDAHIKLKDLPNVKFIGAQQPERLPCHLAKMQVAIIPFVKNEFTRNIYPLKINEYLAAGLPVVSTDFSDLSDFEDLISIKGSTEEFIKAIKLSLINPEDNKGEKIAVAKSNDWSSRANQLNTILSQYQTNHA